MKPIFCALLLMLSFSFAQDSSLQTRLAATFDASCASGSHSPTPADQEGPYYSPGAPERNDLREDLPGTPFILVGRVLDTNCQPLAQAELDFWQANASGVYDNQAYTLRGKVYSDAAGYYQLSTILPGFYEPRPLHIHVKLRAEGYPELTTQLYPEGLAFASKADNTELAVPLEPLENGEVLGVFFFFLGP